jgi:hypothetical protein
MFPTGASAGTTAFEAAESGLVPNALLALTLNV